MHQLRVYARDEHALEGTPLEEVMPDEQGYAVVEEFDNWCIREVNPSGLGVHIRWGHEYIALDWNDAMSGFSWPTRPGNRYDTLWSDRHTAGFLRLYHSDGQGRYLELRPVLYIAAGSLLVHQYPLLLDRLGQLAVAERSAMTAPLVGPLPSGTALGGYWLRMPSLRQAVRLREAYGRLVRSWPFILREPAVALKRQPAPARVGTIRAERALNGAQQVCRNPGRNHIQVPVLQEDNNTSENRFLVLALERFAVEAEALASILASEAKSIRAEKTPPPETAASAVQLWRQGRATASGAANELDRIACNLNDLKAWAKARRDHGFLKAIRPQVPLQPSLKLTRSPGYSTVYHTYQDVFGRDEGGVKLDILQHGLMERGVRPTQELYEIWLFLETYQLLIDRFGFRPVDNQPLAHLELQAGRLQLQRAQQFNLELRLINDPAGIYQISLTYEPKAEYLACNSSKNCWIHRPNNVCPGLPCYRSRTETWSRGPDVVLETRDRSAIKRFALDAKYRRYDEQRVRAEDRNRFRYDKNWEIDVLGHAKQKYRDGIGFDAAWVVHSDPQYTFFGGTEFRTHPHREVAAGLSFYPAHTYGAVYAVPFATANLEILLRCLLMYHAGWYDICWACHKRLKPKPGIGATGVYYQCEEGHDFWVKSNCTRSKDHRLIKMGERSFHQVKRGNVWNCHCPECGDRLPDRESTYPGP